MASIKSITFANGANNVTVNPPAYGYTTIITLPLYYSPNTNGDIGIFDAGVLYTRRACKCHFVLDNTNFGALNTFMTNATKGRGEELVLSLGTESGFYPFAPDLGDEGDFTVRIIGYETTGRVDVPYGHFRASITMQYISGAVPSYVLPTQYDSGNFKMGTVDKLRYPQDDFGVASNYAISNVVTKDGDVCETDLSSSADNYKTSFVYEDHLNKFAPVVDYLVNTARGNNFTITAPSDYYLFGIDNADHGVYTVQLMAKELVITHSHYDGFKMPLALKLVSYV